MLTSEVKWQLRLARRFIRRAMHRSDDEGRLAATEAIVAAQDGLEFLLWAIITAGGTAPSKHMPNFDQVLEAAKESCPRVSAHSAEIRKINKLRNLAKHQGIAPDLLDVRPRVRRAMTLAVELSALPPINVDLLTLSSASGFRHLLLAEEFIQAERILDSGTVEKSQDFLRHLARARALMRLEMSAIEGFSSGFDGVAHAAERWSRNETGVGLKDAAKAADDLFASVFDRIAEVGMRVSTAEKQLWDDYLPPVVIQHGLFHEHQMYAPLVPVTEAVARHLFSSLLELAERLEDNPRRFTRAPSTWNSGAIVESESDAISGSDVVCRLRPGDSLRRSNGGLFQVFGLACVVRSARQVPKSALQSEDTKGT